MPWPSIAKPSYPLGEELVFPAVRTEFENGTVQARPKWTRARLVFSLSWTSMTEGDFTLLKAAFVADQGLSFSWTHPVSGTAYTVRYREDSLKGEVNAPGRRRVQCVLEEV